MRFGCCGSMISPAVDPIGIEAIDTMAAEGFDYAELSLAHIAALDDAAFSGLARRVERSGIFCEACNNFFPPAIRLTGPDAQPEAARSYARRALERAARLGVQTVVFGSSGARNVPEGFSRRTARSQIVDLLRVLGAEAEPLGIMIAIEPINQLESNIINLASEGLRLAREADHPHVQLLVDYYHLALGHEDAAAVVEAGAAVRHVHLAQIEGRRFPHAPEAGMRSFFAALRMIGYTGRCSIEAYTENFAADARRTLAFVRTQACL